jgi:hypothetical protein
VFRRNADADFRELERRAAASGHPDDVKAAVRARVRAGQVTAEWIVAAGPLTVRLLPKDLVQALSRTLQASAVVREPVPDAGGRQFLNGWFPEHRSMDVCPRGDEIDEELPFVRTVAGEEREEVSAYYTDHGRLEVHDDWETTSTGMGAGLVTCTACGAVWPSSPRGLLG